MKVLFSLLIAGLVAVSWTQIVDAQSNSFNNNFTTSFINQNTPKSPESESIERYGNIPVSEYSGIPNISVPLYTLQANKLTLPISLSYNSSGVKVNQEATWVGLGWDLNAGGRITLEVKGGYDHLYAATLNGFGDMTDNKSAIGRMFRRLVPSGSADMTIVAYSNATTIDVNNFDTSWDDHGTVEDILKTGMAEPDIFHANFMGESFSFYQDLLTGQIKFKGEKNTYNIVPATDGNGNIISWNITDNSGIQYGFQQQEQSYYYPYMSGILPSATTSWLLTKIIYPNSGPVTNAGDTISFTYSNFGCVYPAPSISESLYTDWAFLGGSSFTAMDEYTSGQKVYISPQYLTRIDTKNAQIQFSLANRLDLAGAGAKALSNIRVFDKQTQQLIKKIDFSYDYFPCNIGDGFYYSPAMILSGEDLCSTTYNGATLDSVAMATCMQLRLRLLSVNTHDSTNPAPYQFRYNPTPLPNKVSISQDHWGYYNGTSNNAVNTTMPKFLPSISLLQSEGLLGSQICGLYFNTNGFGNFQCVAPPFTGSADRRCNEQYLLAGILDTIMYPTGGVTAFAYEANRSYYSITQPNLVGGGVRVKSIMNYGTPGVRASRVDYSYVNQDGSTSGVYLGKIYYLKTTNEKFGDPSSPTEPNNEKLEDDAPSMTFMSNGDINESGQSVAYTRVQETSIDLSGNATNGYCIKNFYLLNPSAPFDSNSSYISVAEIANTPGEYLDGKIMSERYFDASDTLKKEVDYYYSQAQAASVPYAVKASFNQIGGAPGGEDLLDNRIGTPHIGYYTLYCSIAKSYFTQLDSMVEKDYSSAGYVRSKKSVLYNSFFQPEYTSTVDSKGGETIVHSITPLSYTALPQPPTIIGLTGNALSVQWLRNFHIYDAPVENILIKRHNTGDSTVINGAYNVYDNYANIIQTYVLDTSGPIPLSQFHTSTYSSAASSDLIKDTRYALHQSADYYPYGSYIMDLVDRTKRKAFIWDVTNSVMSAAASNAVQSDIAYASFDTQDEGNWSYSGTATMDTSAPSGEYCYNLGQAGGNITKNGLNSSTIYVITYWTKNSTPYSITGTQTGYPIKGKAVGSWTYYEHRIASQTGITISGTGFIDELRLFPLGAAMVSESYSPLIGIISMSDASGKIIHYSYDVDNRLSTIRDIDKNLIKKFDYRYAPQSIDFNGTSYLSRPISQAFTKNNCTGGAPSTVVYTVPEGKYTSTVSQAAADQLAQNDVSANGQNYANANGACIYFSTFMSGMFTQNNCQSGYVGYTVFYSVPSGKYTSVISQADANQLASNDLNTYGQALADTGQCMVAPPMITLTSSASGSAQFLISLTNTTTHTVYNFSFVGNTTIGQIPEGTYNITINPSNDTGTYTYHIGSSTVSNVTVGNFTNISLMSSTQVSVF